MSKDLKVSGQNWQENNGDYVVVGFNDSITLIIITMTRKQAPQPRAVDKSDEDGNAVATGTFTIKTRVRL